MLWEAPSPHRIADSVILTIYNLADPWRNRFRTRERVPADFGNSAGTAAVRKPAGTGGGD